MDYKLQCQFHMNDFLRSWIQCQQKAIPRKCEYLSLFLGMIEEHLNSCIVALYYNSC